MSRLVAPSLAFIVTASPETFKVTHNVLGSWVTKPMGILLHLIAFLVLTYLFRIFLKMLAPQVSFKGTSGSSNTTLPTKPETCSCPDKSWKYFASNASGERCEKSK